MKGLATLVFFLVFTILIGTGLALGVGGSSVGWLLMTLSLIAYLVIFIMFGCRTSSH
ncbi:MAG TPA: hypothetical protein PLX89_18545 [Verrucomicrobiota bacterium]|nr:hypothetical protein [Verrucomicrobiota bacterium]